MFRYNFLILFFFLFLVGCGKRHIALNSVKIQESWAKASKEIESSGYSCQEMVPITKSITIPVKDDSSENCHYVQLENFTGKSSGISDKPGLKEIIKAAKTNRAVNENSPMAVDAFVFSLLGFALPPLISTFVLGPPGLLAVIGILGFILLMAGMVKGIKAMKELKNKKDLGGRGFAITAIILGSIVILAIIAALVLLGL